MGLYNDASLIFLPSGGAGKDTKAYSVKPTDGTGDFTFSRGSNLAATRVGPTGLIEKGRENHILHSQNLTNAVYIDGGSSGYSVVRTANYGNAPDGTQTADRIQISRPSGNTYAEIYQRLSTLAGSACVLSFYGKSLSGNATLYGGYSNAYVGEFDFTTEWQRFQVFIPNAGNQTGFNLLTWESLPSTSQSADVLIWGVQLEQGLAATDYIESGATTGKAGLLEDEPRFDYSGGASCPSLLLEPQRSNLLPYSEYFGASNWTKTNVAVTDNATTSPEGVDNAVQITESASGLNVYAPSDTLSGSASSYTYSAFLKQGSLRYGGIRAIVNGFANRFFVNVDLQEGTITDTDTTGTGVTWSYDIEDYGSGWYRVWISGTNTSGNIDLAIGLSNSATPTFLSGLPYYTGTGSDYIYAYGAQAEAGSYPTSYIPNHSGGSVTRGEDDINKLTGVGVTSDEFTIFLEFDLSDTPLVHNPGTYFQTFDSSNNSQQEFRFFTWAGEQVLVPYFRQNFSYPFGNGTDAVRFDGKILFRADGGGGYTMFFGFNGSSTKEVRTGLTAYTLNKIDFLSQPKTNVKQLLIFNEALSDADCITLTT